MTEQLKEALSAVVDGEADVFELRRVLDEVGRSPALADAWHRYHLIGEHLRGEPVTQSVSERSAMADAVWASAIEAAPATGTDSAFGIDTGAAARQEESGKAALFSVVDEPVAAAPAASLKKWAPVAVAASVAMMVLIGFNGLSGGDNTSTQPAVVQDNITIEGPVYQLATEVSPSDVRRANAYMLHHVQHKAMNAPGVASFVKVATFERAE